MRVSRHVNVKVDVADGPPRGMGNGLAMKRLITAERRSPRSTVRERRNIVAMQGVKTR